MQWAANSVARRLTNGDDEYGADTGLKDAMFEGGEEDTFDVGVAG